MQEAPRSRLGQTPADAPLDGPSELQDDPSYERSRIRPKLDSIEVHVWPLFPGDPRLEALLNVLFPQNPEMSHVAGTLP